MFLQTVISRNNLKVFALFATVLMMCLSMVAIMASSASADTPNSKNISKKGKITGQDNRWAMKVKFKNLRNKRTPGGSINGQAPGQIYLQPKAAAIKFTDGWYKLRVACKKKWCTGVAGPFGGPKWGKSKHRVLVRYPMSEVNGKGKTPAKHSRVVTFN